MAPRMYSFKPLLLLVLISVTNAATPFLIRQPSIPRGTCPNSERMCRLTDTCCPNNICCPQRTPFCTTFNICVDAQGRTRCPSVEPDRVVLGTLCSSNPSNCCTPPFDRCSQGSPVRCVNERGQVRCLDPASGEIKAGNLCDDDVCCIEQNCCRRDDGTVGCCPTGDPSTDGQGRPLELAPLETGFPGESPIPTPTRTPMGSVEAPSPTGPVETPNSSPSVMPTAEPQQPMPPMAGTDGGSEMVPSLSMEPTMDGGDGDDDGGNGDDDDDSICLPASAKVEVEGKGLTRVEDLQTGEMVRVSNGAFSRVFMWTHRDARYVGRRFVRVVAEKEIVMTATEGHMVYVCRGMREGCEREMSVVEDVRVGDGVWKAGSGADEVVRVMGVERGVRARGLFNPQTEHGDLVVDGMVATCYTKYVPVEAAHALLAPLRAMFRGGLSLVEEM